MFFGSVVLQDQGPDLDIKSCSSCRMASLDRTAGSSVAAGETLELKPGPLRLYAGNCALLQTVSYLEKVPKRVIKMLAGLGHLLCDKRLQRLELSSVEKKAWRGHD